MVAPGHHGYQRVVDLLSGQASCGPNGSPVFDHAGKTVPPSPAFFSQTSVGLYSGVNAHRVMVASSSSPHIPWFDLAAFPRPDLARCVRRRAQDGSRLAVAPAAPSASRFQAMPRGGRARRQPQAGRGDTSLNVRTSKSLPLASTAQAMRASLFASAIASTLWCSRFVAAPIQWARPWRSHV